MFTRFLNLASDSNLYDFAWPVSRLGEAIEVLGRKSHFLSKAMESAVSPENLGQFDDELIGQWIEMTALKLGLEAEPIETSYAEIDQLISAAGPALFRLPDTILDPKSKIEPCFLAVLKGGRWVSVVAPDLSVRFFRPKTIRLALCHALEAPLTKSVDQLLDEANVPEHRRKDARMAILHEWLGLAQIGGCWLLRLSPSAGIKEQFFQANLLQTMLTFIGAHIIWQILQVFSWWIVGREALSHFDWIWLQVWALVSLTAIPFQLLALWNQSKITAKIGMIFKQRLFYGALNLKIDETRHQGVGQFLGRVMESDALELLALSGGFVAVVSVIELTIATAILARGAGGLFHAMLLWLWIAYLALIGWQYWKQSNDWTEVYREMTNDLVERMVGQRTRLAQENRKYWHDEEDQSLDRYLKLSVQSDKISLQYALIPRGWWILGLAGIAYIFVTTPTLSTELAISLGGIMLAAQALSNLIMGTKSIMGLLTAWEQVKPLFNVASQQLETKQDWELHLQLVSPPTTSIPLLSARDLAFRYREHGRPILQGCNLQIFFGDRLLLEGHSGGGKSTLAAILTGLRNPQSGLLLWRGFDRQTVGSAEWRRRVIAAPQFHENHVLAETFAFNLLIGRNWPPSPEELVEAESVCRELGLGELLEQMPAGLQQMVGESGWQLSHGECSRLYIARAILQKADLIVLDENFAALDPENLQLALQCVLNRAPTLLVIAHP